MSDKEHDMTWIIRDGHTVRATAEGKLKVLGVPFNTPSNRDRLGEYITPSTDIMLRQGETRPTLVHHGFTTDKKPLWRPKVVGDAKYQGSDEKGHWFEVTLRGAQEFVDGMIQKAKDGLLKASSGAVSHLVRTSQDGHVDVWPVGELSLVDTSEGQVPVSDLAVAMPARAVVEWFSDAEIEYPFSQEGEEPAEPEADGRITITEQTWRVTNEQRSE